MEPKFEIGQEMAWTGGHKAYAIGPVVDIKDFDGVTHYGFEHSGYIPENELKAV